jgi:hypothetical protein
MANNTDCVGGGVCAECYVGSCPSVLLLHFMRGGPCIVIIGHSNMGLAGQPQSHISSVCHVASQNACTRSCPFRSKGGVLVQGLGAFSCVDIY